VEEQAFLEEGHVTVTRSHIVIGNQTYPVATSVHPYRYRVPNLLGPSYWASWEVLLLFGLSDRGFLNWRDLAGRSLVEAGKIDYTIFFGTAGERRALESEDADYVDRVARAIDQHLSLKVQYERGFKVLVLLPNLRIYASLLSQLRLPYNSSSSSLNSHIASKPLSNPLSMYRLLSMTACIRLPPYLAFPKRLYYLAQRQCKGATSHLTLSAHDVKGSQCSRRNHWELEADAPLL